MSASLPQNGSRIHPAEAEGRQGGGQGRNNHHAQHRQPRQQSGGPGRRCQVGQRQLFLNQRSEGKDQQRSQSASSQSSRQADQQEFSANVSHELKTPLHAISGYAELIENGLVKEEDIKPFAEKIHAESLRMTKLIEDIIDLTKLDSGDVDMKWEDCDLYRIAENAVDSLEAAASEMDITIDVGGESAPVKAIPQLLYSIAYNLCDNAIKYNHSGGNVTITVEQKEDYTVLSVKDTGIGIPEAEQRRIFERFYRVDKSRSKEVGGTGLGLSIVKHAVMIHNGKIEVKSAVGEGSEFIVTIPNHPEEMKL